MHLCPVGLVSCAVWQSICIFFFKQCKACSSLVPSVLFHIPCLHVQPKPMINIVLDNEALYAHDL